MFEVSKLFKIGMFQHLGRRPTLILVIDKHFLHHVLSVARHMRYHTGKALPLLGLKADLHVCCVLSEVVEDILRWGA